MQSPRETKRHFLAALFSAIVPGAGQFFLGQRRKGTVLLLILAAVLIGFWPLRFLRFYAGFVLLYCGWIALYIYAACSAQLGRNLPTSARSSKWWLAAILPVTTLTLSLLGRAATRASGFQSFTVPSISMERTILQGDDIVADMRHYRSERPDRLDLVIFFRGRTFFVRRVIAIAGDSIEGQNGKIYVNGKQENEPYVEHTSQKDSYWLNNFGPIYIPYGRCFVMGDNRDFSFDSRATDFGLVDNGAIVGKPLYIFASGRPGKRVR
jgi:signal peptidase I